MRRAGSDSGFHLTPEGATLGFSLLGDFCTKHEIGVQPLKLALGVAEHFENGLPDRVNTRQPAAFLCKEYDHPNGYKCVLLLVGSKRYVQDGESLLGPDSYLAKMVDFRTPYMDVAQDYETDQPRQNFVAAWDEDGCLVHVRGRDNVRRIMDMAEAFCNLDVAFGGKLVEPDERQHVGGLTFVRASKVNPVLAAQILRQDQSEARLRAAAGLVVPQLKVDLKAAGKAWFAISPAWKNKDDENEGLMFWLNPQEQQDYNAGWFTEESLRAWGRNEGPVLRDKELDQEAKRNAKPLKKLQVALRKCHIASPWLTTSRSKTDREKFVIVVSYNQPIKPGWTALGEGEFTLAQLQDAIPSLRAPIQRRPKW